MTMNPKLKIAITSLIALIIIGTTFYHFAEGWRLIDAFYFTTVTLTTVGYGDLHATKDISKIFTAFFAVIGISIALYSLTMIGSDYFSRRESEFVARLREQNGASKPKLGSHLAKADKHIAQLLKRIDKQIKK
ncbi:two pore domain potassium channel family protein [Candidatus Woesearchaeota archaeon]|nr:two pore domain potassium channel family protein [Candidatus Woesearchaeota archaeon]